jgi:hypothetical protein
LYDLKQDPRERNNLAGNPQYAAQQRELAGRLTAFFDRYADPKYDLWRGGRSKARPVKFEGAEQAGQSR